MVQKIILEELEFINQLLNTSLTQMEEILEPKARNILWRLFFPAGQFLQQKSLAKNASLGLLKIDTRLKEMQVVLEERHHPFRSKVAEILSKDFINMSTKIIELPERAQYLIPQIEDIGRILNTSIQEFSEGKE